MSLIKKSLQQIKTKCFINKLLLERSLLETDNEEFKNGQERFSQLQSLVDQTTKDYKSHFSPKELRLLGINYKGWTETEKIESAKRWESMAALYSTIGLVNLQPPDRKLDLKDILLVYNRLPTEDSIEAHIGCFDGKIMEGEEFKKQVQTIEVYYYRAQLHEAFLALGNAKNDPRFAKAMQENRQMVTGLTNFALSNGILRSGDVKENDIVIGGERYQDINQELYGEIYNASEYRLSAYNWLCGNSWDFDEFVPFITL
ncbi:hypothetical protein HDV01_005199 [Terramyces sp. JEL0728]|nr:hypothetical protein HDV01_005199 [Terramyces sp. JEL0728]